MSLTFHSLPVTHKRDFGRRIEEFWLRLVRAYTFNTPINKGKYRAFQMALALCSHKHDKLFAKVRDGRTLSVDLGTGMQETVFFHGEYERVLTEITRQLIDPGNVCLDVGANFGWYTTLFSMLTGPTGGVHAFEPVPQMFTELQRNVALLAAPENVSINNIALGDHNGAITINLFESEPTGHASAASKGRGDITPVECTLSTLDSYLNDNEVNTVDFVKVDIEGSEMMFLEGASKLFEQNVPPIFLMEMALATSKHFGYLPNDLIIFLAGHGDYHFFKVDEIAGTLHEIKSFGDEDIGANVFSVPEKIYEKKRPALTKYLIK